MRAVSAQIVLLLFPLVAFVCFYVITPQGEYLITPLHPRDLLPLLPPRLARPLLSSFRSAADLLPSFVGSATDANGPSSPHWKGACFYENKAWMEFHNKTGSKFGGGTLHIKGEDVIALLPWEEWWEFELTKDESNPHIALLPLHPDLRANFNESAAWEYARSMEGRPYGYHNLIFSWIDTIDGNYPHPLDAHLVASAMTMWSRIQPEYAANMWNEALNKRLGTKGLDLPAILVESERHGISFDKLLTIPEQDNWLYTDGYSTSCIAFVLEMYKKAGLFDPIADSIQVTEFTIKDAYTLKFFEDNSTRFPGWCNQNDDVELPFCQILGRYRMELPEYNTMLPYPHMNERCPSLPPEYQRSRNC